MGLHTVSQWSHHHLKHFLNHVVGNSANTSSDFALIMAVLLKLFNFNAIWNSGKEKDSHGTATGVYVGCGMAFVLFWALDSCTDKVSQSWICWKFDAYWDCHSYFSELTKVKFANGRNSVDGDCSVFKDKCLRWVDIFFCLVCWWTLWVLDGFSRDHTIFELRKPLRNLCSSPFLLYKSHLNVSNVSVPCFPSLKQNLIQTCCSFKSDFFQVFQIWKYVNTHVCNMTLLSNHTCCRLILCRK